MGSLTNGLIELINKGYNGYEAYKIYERFENRYFAKHYKDYLFNYNNNLMDSYLKRKDNIWDRYVKLAKMVRK